MKDIDKVKKAMNCLNGGKIEVELFPVEHSDNQDGEIICIDGWINLVPVIVNEIIPTIAYDRKRKVKKWDIEALTHWNGDRETPPEDDYVVVAEKLFLETACKKAWQLIIENNIENVFESIAYEEDQEADARYEKIDGI